jgi:methionyl-tRNA formyltransferase
VRALTPHVGASIELPGEGGADEQRERLGVRWARALVPADASYHLAPGALAADGGRLLLGCADGALELLEVQPAGGRAMAAADWLRGSGAAIAAGAAGDRPRGREPRP